MDPESGATNGGSKQVIMTADNKRNLKGWDVVLMRLLALAFSMAAAVVVGLDKQTMTVPVINIQFTAEYSNLSAYVYFVAANAIACAYAAISLFLTLAKLGGKKRVSMMIMLFDLTMVALLFSSIGAGTAIGLMGYQGNTTVQWKSVCKEFKSFCDQGMVGICLSGAATVLFFLLVVLATLNLHKKH